LMSDPTNPSACLRHSRPMARLMGKSCTSGESSSIETGTRNANWKCLRLEPTALSRMGKLLSLSDRSMKPPTTEGTGGINRIAINVLSTLPAWETIGCLCLRLSERKNFPPTLPRKVLFLRGLGVPQRINSPVTARVIIAHLRHLAHMCAFAVVALIGTTEVVPWYESFAERVLQQSV